MLYELNIIGAGKLGKTLGKLIIESKQANLKAVCNAGIESARQAIDFFQQGQAFEDISNMPSADLWMIATKDDNLSSVFQKLIKYDKLKENNVIFHCSGAESSRIFFNENGKKFYSASIHPAYSFRSVQQNLKNFQGIFCALEGEEFAKNILKKIFLNMGMQVYEILEQQKIFYHIAGVIATNYLVTLYNITENLLLKAEIDSKKIKFIILNYLQNTLENIRITENIEEALTGPIQRGDFGLIQKHLNALKESDYSDLYKILGLHTLDIVKIEDNIKLKIREILEN